MKVIYKYELEITDSQTIKMPENADILTVKGIRDKIYLWAFVESNNKLCDYNIMIFGTGNPIEESFNGKYIGMCAFDNNSFIAHVFLNK